MHRKKIRFLYVFVTVVFLLMLFNSISPAQEIEALPPFKIVQLGDSYSAGNGARSESGDRNYYGVSGCYRSPTNWGSQFAESLKDTFAVTYINRACSGGVVNDIRIDRDMKPIYIKTPIESCPSAEYPDEEYWEKTPFYCTRFIIPQIRAIDNSVDLVLMTMGGNDLGFESIVKNCFSALRTPFFCRGAVNDATDKLEELETNLKNTFAAVKAKLRPGAKIAYVSYPQLLLDEELILEFWVEGRLVDSYNAGTKIRALSLSGELHQRDAVNDANAAAGEEYIVFYDGTKPLFEGHEPDPSLIRRNPDRWINEFEGIMAEWYHPNSLGHENWGGALSPFETFGAVGGTFETNADIDVAFVVDTTGSMEDDIAQVRADLSSLVGQLAATTDSYRVAVVSYRDFPQRTGWSGDYPYRVDQTFTDDPVLIQSAINFLTADGGGDWEETVFSGIQAAIDLPWRPGVTKVAIVIGDAPALSPEPISNLTAAQIVANSIAVDPVQIIGVNTGYLNDNGAFGQIADGTGGAVIQGTSGLTTRISEILYYAANKPFAWIGQAYSGKIGQPILFDASGSYDPSGLPITLYEWDFDGDGVFDLETTDPITTHIYETAFNDFVVLRVTGQGGTALASARTVVNAEGFASQGDEDSCELDENGYSIILDEKGRFIPCTADSLPESGIDGVREISGNSNNPPTANAGLDQTVERVSVAGASVTLDGSGSYDPDGDALTYSWTWNGGSATGVAPTVTLPMGLTMITLTVLDGQASSTDTVSINVVDMTAPSVSIVTPIATNAVQDGVTLAASASDLSGVASVSFFVRQPDDGNGIPIGNEDLAGTFNASTGQWKFDFDSTQVQDGYYVVLAKAVDTYGNEAWSTVVPFSIRNWAVITLLPSTPNSKAGRTMPVKLSLRVASSVDPAMPFVFNDELEIRIYKTSNPGTILQTSRYGSGSKDYRISSTSELYITNFKTLPTPADYTIEIWRTNMNWKVGSLTFKTVK